MNTEKNAQQDPWKHTLAVQSAAAMSTFLFYPLDSIKLRIMAQNGTASRSYHSTGRDFISIRSALRDTIHKEGITTLYRGCTLAVLGSTISWGTYMFLYKTVVDAINHTYNPLDRNINSNNSNNNNNNSSNWFVLYSTYFASLSASCVTAIFTNPIWLVKVRMQLQEKPNYNNNNNNNRMSSSGPQYYRGLLHGCTSIITREGYFGLFRGVVAQALMAVPNALYIPMYEMLKRVLYSYRATSSSSLTSSSSPSLSSYEIAACTICAKTMVAICSNPILVVKTKMQDHRNSHPSSSSLQHKAASSSYVSIRATINSILTSEGIIRGLLIRGLAANLSQTTPRAVCHILLYENILSRVIS